MRRKSTAEQGHGRIDKQNYTICPIPDSMKSLTSAWAGAQSIVQVVNLSEDSRGNEIHQVRYDLSSPSGRVGGFARNVRGHWSIESLHWILDVVFHEDASRVRTGDAQANLSQLRKYVTGLPKGGYVEAKFEAEAKIRRSEYLLPLLQLARFLMRWA